jgi:AraC family transcriptional regulator
MTKRSRRPRREDPDLSFNLSGTVVYPPGTTLGPRRLADFEMVWFLQGNAVYEHDGHEERLDTNSVVLALPGTQERYTWDPKRRTQHGFFHFHIRKPIQALPPPESWPRVRHMPENDALRPLLHHIAWLVGSRPPHWQRGAAGALKHALFMFVHDLTRTAASAAPTGHPALERALEYLKKIWTDRYDNCSLKRLAAGAGTSPTHLNRLFRSEIGMSPGRALRILRLQRAAVLLSRTSSSVQEISELCGFATQFHFSDTFRRNYGISPRTYRKRSLEGTFTPTLMLGRLKQFHPDLTFAW